ncbi:tetratricopeptide repeat protein [Rhodoplanes sp. Z2-YC6860]|uniref:tetratricopeptide repeat protein n=1 Tax=Rhodoplanes sp. Z2-YC6860 TaxID=674703 RepID=UPI00078E910F|nr:tetratricopeptide repeat protein [Rhodoplanes sp. Z2-YC6860]AMN43110.1 Sel1 domain-containing protein [Rhodoplanes sp. Z2-YC6860]
MRLVMTTAAVLLITAAACRVGAGAEVKSQPQYDLSEALVYYARLDYPVAYRMLLPMANSGNAVAQETLGFMYSRGEGVAADDVMALRWFKLAAIAGRPDAEFEIGKFFRDGRGVPADGKAALFWFRRAADHGMTEAFVAVAELYLGQSGMPPDPAAASEWLLRAADLGSGEAMYLIGLRYADGRDEPRDDIEAFKWFDLALSRAIGTLRDDAARARMKMAERLMPMQVQVALTRSRDWKNAHLP